MRTSRICSLGCTISQTWPNVGHRGVHWTSERLPVLREAPWPHQQRVRASCLSYDGTRVVAAIQFSMQTPGCITLHYNFDVSRPSLATQDMVIAMRNNARMLHQYVYQSVYCWTRELLLLLLLCQYPTVGSLAHFEPLFRCTLISCWSADSADSATQNI